jgi:hypothetical protein
MKLLHSYFLDVCFFNKRGVERLLESPYSNLP